MSTSRAELARQVVAASHALHARGWVANHDGNVSVRWGERFLVTPTATSKADAAEGNLAVTDGAGKPVEGETRPPSEFALHLGAYRVRADVNAVVHAHPPYATAMACAGEPVLVCLPEAVVSIGARIPLSRFALPFGAEGSAVVEELVDRHDAIVLCRHGVITVGCDVEQAMLRMELVEHLARIQTLAIPHGGVRPLPEAVIEPLLAKRRKAAGILGAAAALAGLDDDLRAESAPQPGSGSTETDDVAPFEPRSVGPGSAAFTPKLPTDLPPAASWKPAGPPPAPDAWSGGRSEGECGVVYGAPGVVPDDLADAIRAEVSKHLKG